MEIYPSLISSDLLNLKHTIDLLDAHCDGYHLDVMDDHFVPNLTWGPAFVNAIRTATVRPLYIHLMVDDPVSWPSRLALAGTDTIIFHHEALHDVQQQKKLLTAIHAKGCKVGIAINPATPAEHVYEVLSLVDVVLVMSVQPGFSGQRFIPEVTQKIETLSGLRKRLGKNFSISVDGGVNEKNIEMLARLHVDVVAVAAALFNYKDPVVALKNLYKKLGV